MSEENEIRRNTKLEMQLQGVKSAFIKLKFEAAGLVAEVIGSHTNKEPESRAKRLQAVIEALEELIH